MTVKDLFSHRNIVYLITDFGVDNVYTAEMKSVIYGGAKSDVAVIDLTHSITPFDVQEAAFVIGMVYPFFPRDSVCVAVIDPGVGSDRRGIIVRTPHHFFVGPDNGIFTYVYRKEKNARVYHIKETAFEDVSSTFHGRDIFAPTAVNLVNGKSLRKLGKKIEDYVILQLPEPSVSSEEGKVVVRGRIMYVDNFGNLISNIPVELIPDDFQEVYIKIGRTLIHGIARSFSDVPLGKPLVYGGSHGYLEVGVNKGNAHNSIGAGKGSSMEVIFIT